MMTKQLLLILGISFNFFDVFGIEEDTVTYETQQGNVRGVIRKSRNGEDFYGFLGIPYAQPPIGIFRWQPPQTAPRWEGTLDATKLPNECTQDEIFEPTKMVGSEDCLYLNVFTKGKGAKKQVLLWIHGGAFIFGGIGIYNPEYVMEEDIVLVTIQYRLNIFGFMSTEDSASPGNYGMLDQVAALKWVQENIAAYGGDPDQVTIFGMSAGGASVHYLTLSPLSRNLYKNAISLSGSALCWWANVPHPRKNAITLGHHFDCPMSSSKEMVDCLRKIPTEKLHDAHVDLFFHWHKTSTERQPMNVFSPRSDPEAGPEAFLPEHPYVAMKKGHINPQPHMIGFTDKEGIWKANEILPDGSERSLNTWKDFASNFTKIAPWAFGLFGNQCKNPEKMVGKLKTFYNLNNIDPEMEITDELVHNIIDVLSDSMFSYPVDEAAKLRAEHKHLDTYYHYLTFSGTHTLANMDLDGNYRKPPLLPLRRASHGADMLQIFNMFPEFDPMPENELQFSRKLIKLLIDWGKNGKPPQYLSDWKRFDVENPSYLVIDEEFKIEKGTPDSQRLEFWRNGLQEIVYWEYVLKGNTLHDEL